MTTLNLTQHPTSAAQRDAGVVEPSDKSAVQALLSFTELPTSDEVRERAEALAQLAVGHESAMLGGAPFLMHPLHEALLSVGVTPVYAFSLRQSQERVNPETGETEKVSVFAHLGFV